LLTAQHCRLDSNDLIVDGDAKPTKILSETSDGNDHILLIVDKTFSQFAPINQRKLIHGEEVHEWGNPLDEKDVYRVGTFDKQEVEWRTGLMMPLDQYILPVFPGDSGSAIFDKNGQIVGVVTASHGAREFSLPLAFTAEQLKNIK